MSTAMPGHEFGRPRDPIAHQNLGDALRWSCHCGWGLRVEDAISDGTDEGAPGPIVPCGKCGCYVALPAPMTEDGRDDG